MENEGFKSLRPLRVPQPPAIPSIVEEKQAPARPSLGRSGHIVVSLTPFLTPLLANAEEVERRRDGQLRNTSPNLQRRNLRLAKGIGL